MLAEYPELSELISYQDEPNVFNMNYLSIPIASQVYDRVLG